MKCNWSPGCDRDSTQTRFTRGFCHYHYKKAIEHGEIALLEKPSFVERFEAHFTRQGGYPDFTDPYVRVTEDAGECWIWTSKTRSAGYGRVKKDGRLQMAHRVSLEVYTGWEPNELDVDHLCRRALCVNPMHLEPVTRRENTLRGRTLQVNFESRRTHCGKGHRMTPENTIDYPGQRKCRACQNDRNREWMRQYRARQAEEV